MANVFTVPASAPFAETLAHGLIARTGARDNPLALADVTLYLPTRRAVRTLSETFARSLGGAALLPNMRPLGDVDEEEFLFTADAEALLLPPSISPVRRVLLLASLVKRWDRSARRGDLSFAQAVGLSRALAGFLDEVNTQGCDLSQLEALAPQKFSRYWENVADFLKIIRDAWPDLLAAEGRMDPAAQRNLALSSLAARLRKNPPQGMMVAAGSTGSIPATADLLQAISNLPNGLVVLPGLDTDLDSASWADLDPGHPQYGLKQLLQRIEVDRAAVAVFDDAPQWRPRETLIREALRPAPTTDAWRALAEMGRQEIADGLDHLSLLEAGTPGEEAGAIALLLRHTLETSGRTAALVTPDRKLARQVAAEMRRWNIAIDDSGGRPLANTPPGAYLCLLAEAAAENFAPVPLLGLLKHPLASGGQATATFRRRVRQLDRLCLRGPRPDPGLGGIQKAIDAALQDAQRRERQSAVDRITELADWFRRVREMLQPMEQAFASREADLSDLLAVHLATAEALAASDTDTGAARLWRAEAGEAAAKLTAELQEAAPGLPPIEVSSYPVLFRSFAEQIAVRPLFGGHPRLAILGPLEARLQRFDVVVLGGLNEGSWPAVAQSDPWLSRPMRAELGLEAPERRIGLSAHDFAMLACSPQVVLTRALKANGSPTVASHWLQRLQQLTKGLSLDKMLAAETPYVAFAALRDQPQGPPRRELRPRPRPPLEARPKALSVTEIETWLRDPYAVYAKHVLHLRPLDPLDAEIGALERGRAVHEALEKFLQEFPDELPDHAPRRLIEIAEEVFARDEIPHSALVLWRPRFVNAAIWFVGEERLRRARMQGSHLEIEGRRVFKTAAGEFTLRGRADRIDMLQDGTAAIVDYKTGSLPSNSQIKTLLSPQLPLEALILADGGFTDIGKLRTSELTYIRFSGGAEPGEIRSATDVPELVARVEANLRARLLDYADLETAYPPRLVPFRSDVSGDYDHLARVREWSLSGWEEFEE